MVSLTWYLPCHGILAWYLVNILTLSLHCPLFHLQNPENLTLTGELQVFGKESESVHFKGHILPNFNLVKVFFRRATGVFYQMQVLSCNTTREELHSTIPFDVASVVYSVFHLRDITVTLHNKV